MKINFGHQIFPKNSFFGISCYLAPFYIQAQVHAIYCLVYDEQWRNKIFEIASRHLRCFTCNGYTRATKLHCQKLLAAKEVN